MQDLLWLLYIGLWLAAARFASHTRVLVPRVAQVGGAVFVADQRPLGLMVLLFCGIGAALGAFEPRIIHNVFLRPQDAFNELGRLAQIVGGVCGAYVGARAVRLWILLFLAWAALRMLFHGVHGQEAPDRSPGCPSNMSWQGTVSDAFQVSDFVVDWDGQVVRCPEGKQSAAWATYVNRKRPHRCALVQMRFRPADCRACPSRARCTRAAPTRGRYLTLHPRPKHEALVAARAHGRTAEYRRLYA